MPMLGGWGGREVQGAGVGATGTRMLKTRTTENHTAGVSKP